jgi:hypothetical protein
VIDETQEGVIGSSRALEAGSCDSKMGRVHYANRVRMLGLLDGEYAESDWVVLSSFGALESKNPRALWETGAGERRRPLHGIIG